MRKKYYRKENRVKFFNDMVLKYGDRCMICGQYVRHLVIDHDHETGFMRGLLCSRHNSGIGHFNDNPNELRAAADYLEEAIKVNASMDKPKITKEEDLSIDILNEIIKNSSFGSDADRARFVSKTYGLTYSAAQSRISRGRSRLESMQNLD